MDQVYKLTLNASSLFEARNRLDYGAMVTIRIYKLFKMAEPGMAMTTCRIIFHEFYHFQTCCDG